MAINSFAGKRYLVVDDFADMRATVRSMLHSLGIPAVDQARDGAGAIALIEETRYDVVLCDYNLGRGKDGQQVLEEARQRKLLGIDSIFIMITADNTREMVMAAVEYEPDNYLSKPFTKDLLRTRLLRLIERKADLAPVNAALHGGDQGRAIELLDGLIAARPRNLADLLKLKAEICITAGRYDAAAAIYAEALAARDVAWAQFGRGKLLFLTKAYAQAAEVFQALIERNKELVSAYDWLARAQLALNLPAVAEKTLVAAAELSPRAVQRQQLLGDLALNNGNAPLAESAFGRAVQLGKFSVFNHPSLYAGLAKSKTANNKHDEALQAVAELSRTFANDPAAIFYEATATAAIRHNQGDSAGAAAATRQAERAMRVAGGQHAARMGVELARTLSQVGEKQQAAALLQSLVANNHDDEACLIEIARAYRDAGLDETPDAVITRIRRGVVDTNNRGVQLIRDGQLDAAIDLLQQAAAQVPGNRTVNLNAAKALLIRMERHGTAEDSLRQLRQYLDRVRQVAPGDQRLTTLQAQVQRLVLKSM